VAFPFECAALSQAALKRFKETPARYRRCVALVGGAYGSRPDRSHKVGIIGWLRSGSGGHERVHDAHDRPSVRHHAKRSRGREPGDVARRLRRALCGRRPALRPPARFTRTTDRTGFSSRRSTGPLPPRRPRDQRGDCGRVRAVDHEPDRVHRSVQMVRRYIWDRSLFRENSAGKLGL
jgi:hypothetical protein